MFAGVGERTCEGNDLWVELKEANVLATPRWCSVRWTSRRAPACVSPSALTMAEFFRDEQGQDVLLFIDNIFRVHPGRLGRCPPCWAACPRRWVTSRPGRRDGRVAGAHHLDPRPLHHLDAGRLRARRRLHRPGAMRPVRAPGRHHRAFACGVLQGHLPGGGPAGVVLDHPAPQRGRRRALPGCPGGHPNPAALQGPSGHHRHPRHRRGSPRRTSSWSTAPAASSAS